MSAITIYGRNISSCGYCKSIDGVKTETSVSYGVVAEKIEVEHYEAMMLKGWRRSGTYLYKPSLHETCCPAYTIRLENKKFIASKAHRQVIRRVSRYLTTGSIYERRDETIPITTHDLTIETSLPEYTDERYDLYLKYQTLIHHDDPEEKSKKGFISFLVESPLRHKIITKTDEIINTEINEFELPSTQLKTSETISYGTFHQLYRLDGILIAVGVIDILPSGISSVYLYYDPDYKFLELGKYTALNEIKFGLNNSQYNLNYYYMGFYIQSCQKMKYKGEYYPSELMCPSTFDFYPIAECIPLITKYRFTPFHHDLKLIRERVFNENIQDKQLITELEKLLPHNLKSYNNSLFPINISTISLSLSNSIVNYDDITNAGKKFLAPILTEWGNLIGNTLASKITIKLS